MVIDTSDPRATPPAPSPEGPAGTVKVQKRAAPAPGLREKACAACGRTFHLAEDEKFYLCPSCYRRTFPARKPAHRGAARVLIQIRCSRCGTTEYLDFQPPNPEEALCRACFAAERREQKGHLAPSTSRKEDAR
jgi:DNA-directed RNA polymerase subunit RPC12/RpoP